MNQVLLPAVIAALAAIVGAVLSFLATRYTARQENEKLNILYNQKLEDISRENIGQNIDTLYKPINILITKLADRYADLKRLADNLEWEYWSDKLREEFRNACEKYIAQITDISYKGDYVYLTPKLEEDLQSFTYFLKDAVELSKDDNSGNRSSYFQIRYGLPKTNLKFEDIFLQYIQIIKILIRDVTLVMIERPQKEIPQKKKRYVSLGE